jgi:thiol-disulfide isomerase/thioredoxin
MRLYISIVTIICLTAIVTHAQKFPAPLINIGDPAPPLQADNWIKGSPVNSFEKGKIYVVEFWATWCRPCRAEMPHLSALARKYKDRVTVIGIDILEMKATTFDQIKAFVDSMGQRMDYNVALSDSNYMEKNWFNAAGETGIPTSFIVNGEGRLAWIGHPCYFEDALSKIVNGAWDIKKSLAQRNLNIRLINLEDSLNELLEFAPNGNYRNDSWKRDSALLLIDEMARTEPLLKYTPRTAFQTFSILLKTNMEKAYEYGKKVIITTTYEQPAGFMIRGAINNLPKEIKLTPEIYQLGIEAIQVEIDNTCYPELIKLYKLYYNMAEWYWTLGNKTRAIEAQEKAIEDMKSKNDYIKTDLVTYEAWLRYYKKM